MTGPLQNCAKGSPQISDHLKRVLWLYAVRKEITPTDVALLEAEHRQNLQTMHGMPILNDAGMRVLASELGIDKSGRCSFAESVAHVLDCIKTTPGDHLLAIREVLDWDYYQ